MSAFLKSLKYSLFYIGLIILFYFLGVAYCYQLNFYILALIPTDFLAIQYGILYPIKKENYVDKYYILFSLLILTTIFNFVFLSLVKVSIWVILIVVLIHATELILLDLPVKDSKERKIFGVEVVEDTKETKSKKKA